MSKVITPVLLLIVAIGLFFTYSKPAYKNLQDFQAQESEIDDAILEADKLVTRYESLRKDKTSIKEIDLKNLSLMLPDNIDIVGLILDIDRMTSNHNVEISSFLIPYVSPASSKNQAVNTTQSENDYIGSAIITVSVEGTYFDFKNFLFELEKSMTLFDVTSLKIKVNNIKNSSSGTDEKLSFTTDLKIYWFNGIN